MLLPNAASEHFSSWRGDPAMAQEISTADPSHGTRRQIDGQAEPDLLGVARGNPLWCTVGRIGYLWSGWQV